jgi:hypothetical protein
LKALPSAALNTRSKIRRMPGVELSVDAIDGVADV